MLYVNQNLLATSNRSKDYTHSEVVKDYHETIAYVLEYYGDFLVVETKVRPHSDLKTGLPRFPGPRGLLLKSTVNRRKDDGSSSVEELRYSPVILQLDDKGNLNHEDPNLLIHRGTHSIDVKRNPDLAYYVMKCGKVGMTPAEGKKFHIYDVKATDKKKAEKKRVEGAALNMVYTTLSEGNLRILAKSWGIDGVDALDIESVREALWDKLEYAEEQKKQNPNSKLRGFKEFAASAEVKEADKLTALCKDAENTGKLVYDKEARAWFLDYQDGGKRFTLKELAGDEFGDPLSSLVSFLSINDESLRKVKNILGQATIPVEEKVEDTHEEVPHIYVPKFTAEQILSEGNAPKLRKMLKEVAPEKAAGLPRGGVTADDIRRLLLQGLEEASIQETEG
jgi:hypothetical protein